jgi:chlorobactene glucosyltransferase
MYRKVDEAILGFSRNMHEYFGGQRLVMLAFWFLVCLGPFIVFAALGAHFLGLFVALVVVNRLLVAAASRQSVLWSVLIHPLQMFSFTAIVFYNLFRRLKKDTEWKGRQIKL